MLSEGSLGEPPSPLVTRQNSSLDRANALPSCNGGPLFPHLSSGVKRNKSHCFLPLGGDRVELDLSGEKAGLDINLAIKPQIGCLSSHYHDFLICKGAPGLSRRFCAGSGD